MNQWFFSKNSGLFSIIALKLFVTLAFILAWTVQSEATTIIVHYKKGDGIIIASDSKTTSQHTNNNEVTQYSYTTCKIRQFGNVFFTASGVKKAPSFDIDDISARTLSGSGSILEKVKKFRNELLREIPKVLELPSVPGEHPRVFQYIIAGLENGEPMLNILYLPVASNDPEDIQWHSYPRDIPPGKENKYLTLPIGQGEIIESFLREHPNWINSCESLRKLIKMEIVEAPDLVGEPIDCLIINSKGVEWDNKSPDSKCPDLMSIDDQ